MSGQPYNDKGRAEARARQKKAIRRSSVLTLVAAVIFATITILLLQQTRLPYSDYESASQTQAQTPALAVELLVYRQVGQGSYRRLLDAAPQAGDTLVFAVNSTQPLHVALAASFRGQHAFSLFEGARIPPGSGRKLAKGDERFRYRYEASDAPVRFCLIYAEDADKLMNRLQHLEKTWSSLPSSACWEPTAS